MNETGIERLALQLFKNDGAKAKAEARALVKHYKNGAGAFEVMGYIREAKARMGIQPRQQRLDGV